MSQAAPHKSLRPRMVTVFVAAFIAGGTGAVGVNRFIDVARTRSKATVECEPIFVALRDLPAGNPVTVWDVKLRDWPKAMVPQAALRPGSFEGIAWPEGHVSRLSLREGQPVLRSHLQATASEAQRAVAHPVAVAQNPTVEDTTSDAGTPVVVESQPVTETFATSESPIAGSAIASSDAIPPSDAVAASDAGKPDVEPVAEPTEQTPGPVPSPAVAETSVAVSPTPAAPVESSASITDRPKSSEAVTGEGWPSAAETAAGSEAAMRFLVVPERIAIMADELTAPRKPEPPSAPVASVATQPNQPKQAATPKQAAQPNQSAQPKEPVRPKKPAAPELATIGATEQTPTSRQSSPPSKATTKQATAKQQSIPRAKYPDQRPVQPQTRSTPPSPAIRQQASPATKDRPAPRTTAVPTPRVAVEPDPESEQADEAARTPMLRTMFPNMAAGLEKLESEMTRFRRERFGSLFRGTDGLEEEETDSDAEGIGLPGPWLPSLRYR